MIDTEEPPGGGKKHETIIYISNMSEDVWPFISAISDPVERRSEIEENATLSDQHLFTLSGEDHVIAITPKTVSDNFLNYFRDLTGKRDFDIMTTREHTGEICLDILHDQAIMNKIIEAANSSRKLTLISYSTTYQFFKLIRELKNRGLTIYTPEAPEEEDAWTVNFYGSKSGIRQLSGISLAREPDFVMADGLVCVGVEDTARVAARWYIKNDGVVIKTNKGHSGMGLLIFRPGDLPKNFLEAYEKIYKTLKKDAYWSLFPIIIEDYVAAGSTIGGGFPNVEFQIQKSGRINFLFYCGLRVTDRGVFQGIEIQDDVIPERTATQLMDTGYFIAEQYAAAGYRGYFDVDYIYGKNGKLYITESNVRRTGGTHVYHLAKRLFGDDFMRDVYSLSNNLFNLPKGKTYKFGQIMELFKPILYNKLTKEGIVIVSENVLSRGQLGYIIFGKTKKRALEIEEKMEMLLNS